MQNSKTPPTQSNQIPPYKNPMLSNEKRLELFLSERIATCSMAAKHLGIEHHNLTWAKRDLEKAGKLIVVRHGECHNTGHYADFLTTFEPYVKTPNKYPLVYKAASPKQEDTHEIQVKKISFYLGHTASTLTMAARVFGFKKYNENQILKDLIAKGNLMNMWTGKCLDSGLQAVYYSTDPKLCFLRSPIKCNSNDER